MEAKDLAPLGRTTDEQIDEWPRLTSGLAGYLFCSSASLAPVQFELCRALAYEKDHHQSERDSLPAAHERAGL